MANLLTERCTWPSVKSSNLVFLLENNCFFKAIFSAISNPADITSMGKDDDPWYKQAKNNKRKIGTNQSQSWKN